MLGKCSYCVINGREPGLVSRLVGWKDVIEPGLGQWRGPGLSDRIEWSLGVLGYGVTREVWFLIHILNHLWGDSNLCFHAVERELDSLNRAGDPGRKCVYWEVKRARQTTVMNTGYLRSNMGPKTRAGLPVPGLGISWEQQGQCTRRVPRTGCNEDHLKREPGVANREDRISTGGLCP